MKSFLFLAFIFLLMSCNPNQDCGSTDNTKPMKQEVGTGGGCPVPDSDEDSDQTPDEIPNPNDELPQETAQLEASLHFVNFEIEQEEKVQKAIEIIKTVIATKEFRNKVINFTYEGDRKFVDNGGLSNEEIYMKLLKGAEKLRPEDDFEMDLELELYYSSRNVVGYTYPNTVRIWMNTKYFIPYTPAQVAGNIFHEWTHKLGFNHASSYSVARDSSVPYAIGYLVRDLGKKYE